MCQDPVFVVFARFYYEISLCTPCLCGVLNSYSLILVSGIDAYLTNIIMYFLPTSNLRLDAAFSEAKYGANTRRPLSPRATAHLPTPLSRRYFFASPELTVSISSVGQHPMLQEPKVPVPEISLPVM